MLISDTNIFVKKMRYRKRKTIKFALAVLGVCLVGTVFLHRQTDNASNESKRFNCNGPWCLNNANPTPVAVDVDPAKSAAGRVAQINDLVRFHQPDLSNENGDVERANVRNLERRLVDRFDPANVDNLKIKAEDDKRNNTPKKVRLKTISESENLKDVGGEKEQAQVVPPNDVVLLGGPGEMGKPVIIDEAHRNESKKLFKINSFNLMASDMVSLNRTLADVRPEGCAALKYPTNLPKTSLVVVFHNEAWSSLWRTVHSVINRSPACLEEIVLVDDASTQDHLKSRLDEYANQLNFEIKVLHLQQRSGLTVARLRGGDVATGEILVFLDSHCEVTEGWLEPLVYRISQKRSNVVVPIIDVISDETLQYIQGDGVPQIGGFSWGLIFNWQVMQAPDKLAWYKNKTVPIRSPTMAGGLFAIDKAFFNKLGGYDEGFKVWGGENLELSFKSWMCGGSLETMPCSHVGHIFRHSAPYSNGGAGNFMLRNNKRLAEVWLDQYKEFFYFFHPEVRNTDPGDISERIDIRKRLNCKSFDWFLKTVFPESTWPSKDSTFGQVIHKANNYCLDFSGAFKDGASPSARPCKDGYGQQIWNKASNQCLDYHVGVDKGNIPLKTFACHGRSGSQLWSFTLRGEIKHEDKCLDSPRQDQLLLYTCHFMGGNQKWSYDNTTQQLIHLNGRCLDFAANDGKQAGPSMSICDPLKETQRWTLDMKHWHIPASNLSSNKNMTNRVTI